MSWSTRFSAFLAVGAVLVGLQTAAAQDAPVPSGTPGLAVPRATVPAARAADVAAEREAAQARCWADLQTLCPNIESRQDRIRCIRQNRGKLPPSCTQARRARGTPIREACAEDVKKLCADVPRGRAVIQCLVDKRPEVSPACGEAIDMRRGGPGPVRGPGSRPPARGGAGGSNASGDGAAAGAAGSDTSGAGAAAGAAGSGAAGAEAGGAD